MRRRALLIIWHATPDQAPGEVPKKARTETLEILVARGQQRYRPGFVTFGVKEGEPILEALQRNFPYYKGALTSSPTELTRFSYASGDQKREIIVLELGVGKNQRYADLAEQASDSREKTPLPDWHEIGWLYRQAEENLLNDVTSHAMARPEVRDFLNGARSRPQIAA